MSGSRVLQDYTPSSSDSSDTPSGEMVSSWVSLLMVMLPVRSTFTTSGIYSSLDLSGEPTLAAKISLSPSALSKTTPRKAPFFAKEALMYGWKSLFANSRFRNSEPSFRKMRSVVRLS